MSKIIRNSENAFNPEIRKTYIGGTDAAAICGLSEWKTPFEVWVEKTTGVFPEVSEEKQDLFDWGHDLEPLIAKKYLKKANDPRLFVWTNNGFIVENNNDFIAANIDAVIATNNSRNKDYLLECKTASYSQFAQWSNGVPLNYYCQAQWYLMVTGLNKLVFAILVMDSRKLETFEVIRDDEFISKIRTKCIDFWNNHVLTNTPPELSLSDLNKVKPIPDSAILADIPDILLHGQIKGIKAKIKLYEADLKELEDQVKSKMQDKEAICLPDSNKALFTWKTSIRESVDAKKLRDLYPDIYNQVTKTSESRAFLIK